MTLREGPTTPGIVPTTLPSLATTEQAGAPDGAEAPPFVAMWDFEPDEEPAVDNAGLGGTLLIEGPCVYLLTDEPKERWLLMLLRRATRYEPQTGALWMWHRGPFFSGDPVAVGGGQGGGSFGQSTSETCSFDDVWVTHAMSPADRYR